MVNAFAFGERTILRCARITRDWLMWLVVVIALRGFWAGQIFTGKPHIAEPGYSFLFRNYRANCSKWQTADPLDYPDGLNNFAYVNNSCMNYVDMFGLSLLDGISGSGSIISIIGSINKLIRQLAE